MLFPAKRDLKGVIGASWEARIELFADDQLTMPYDLTQAYDLTQVELELDGLVTLNPASGLVVTGATGLVEASMTPSQTGLASGTHSWRLKLPRLDGVGVDYPIGGLCRWSPVP